MNFKKISLGLIVLPFAVSCGGGLSEGTKISFDKLTAEKQSKDFFEGKIWKELKENCPEAEIFKEVSDDSTLETFIKKFHKGSIVITNHETTQDYYTYNYGDSEKDTSSGYAFKLINGVYKFGTYSTAGFKDTEAYFYNFHHTLGVITYSIDFSFVSMKSENNIWKISSILTGIVGNEKAFVKYTIEAK